jgi:hypothetical protein
MKRHLLSLTISAAVIIVPSAKASVCDATTCTFTFDVHNSGPTTFGSGPYGTLNLLLVGDTIQATIDLADGFGLVNTGFPNGSATRYGFAFNDNLDAADFSYSSYNPSTYNGGTTTAGAYQFDGFGNFDRAAADTDLGNSAGANVVSFIITRVGGFNSVQNLVGLSSGNIYFAADVFYNGTNTPATGCAQGASCTGLIGVSGGGSPVPEPISSALVGTGLISLFFLRRRASSHS